MISCKTIYSTIAQKTVHPAVEYEWRGESIAFYAPPDRAVACLHNSERVPPEEWPNRAPTDGDTLVFVLCDDGGGFEDFMEGVTVVVGFATGGILGAASNYALNRFVGRPFRQAIQNFLTPSLPGLPGLAGLDGGVGGASSPAYGFGAVTTSYRDNAAIPVAYGLVKGGGQCLMRWVEADGSGNQIFRILLALSEGPIEQIGLDGDAAITADTTTPLSGGDIPRGIRINELEAAGLRQCRIAARMGTFGQSIITEIPEFNQMVRMYSYSYLLKKISVDFPFEHRSTEPLTDYLINLHFPGGIFQTSSTGTIIQFQDVKFKIQVLRQSDGGTAREFETEALGRLARGSEGYHITIRVDGLPLDKYRLKFWRTRPDFDPEDKNDKVYSFEPIVASIVEKDPHAVGYTGIALLAVELQANEQISGSEPKIVTDFKGRLLYDPREGAHDPDDPDTWEWSRNPALVIRDMLSSERYGAGRYVSAGDFISEELEDFADFCDQDVPITTGVDDEEPRHFFDGLFDAPVSAWEMAIRIAGQCGTNIIKIGDSIGFSTIRPESIPAQLFTGANCNNAGLSFVARLYEPNSIEASYVDEETWDRALTPPAQFDDVVDIEGLRRETADSFGLIRLSEANRFAWRRLRTNRMPIRALNFTAGVDAIAVMPGSIITVNTDIIGVGVWGRIVDVTGSVTTIDRPFTFTAGKVYRFTVRGNDLAILDTLEFVHTGTTDELPFAPGTTGPHEGQLYSITEAATREARFIVVSIDTSPEERRQISAVEFVPDVFTDDAGPTEEGIIAPATGEPPGPVQNLALDEFWNRPGVSDIQVDWDEPVTGGRVARYHVFYRFVSLLGGFSFAGQTLTTSRRISVAAPEGIKMEIAVVAIGPRGEQHPLASADVAKEEILILRDDEEEIIPVYPDPATNVEITNGSNNAATLSWTASANADGYEVRRNGWHDQKVIADTTGTSLAIRRNQFFLNWGVRAYKNNNGLSGVVKYYSADFPEELSDQASPAGFTSQVAVFPASEEDWIFNLNRKNAVFAPVSPFSGFFGSVAMQVEPNQSAEISTPIIDAGSAAETYISLDLRAGNGIIEQVSQFFYSMPMWNHTGKIRKRYVNWGAWIEHSTTDAMLVSFQRFNVLDFNEDIFITSRYFRLRLQAAFAPDITEIAPFSRRIFFPFLGMKLHRSS